MAYACVHSTDQARLYFTLLLSLRTCLPFRPLSVHHACRPLGNSAEAGPSVAAPTISGADYSIWMDSLDLYGSGRASRQLDYEAAVLSTEPALRAAYAKAVPVHSAILAKRVTSGLSPVRTWLANRPFCDRTPILP